MPQPLREVTIYLPGIVVAYKNNPSFVKSTRYFYVSLAEAKKLSIFVNSLDLYNLKNNLFKHTYCVQNKMQLEEDKAHGLLVPTSDPDVIYSLLSRRLDPDLRF